MKTTFLTRLSATFLGASLCALGAPIFAQNSSAPAANSAASFAAPTPEKLPNGLEFLAIPDRTSPRVAFSILLHAGAEAEGADTAGWRRLVVNAMLRRAPGDESGNLESLRRAAETLGGEIGASVGDDLIEIYGVGPSENGPQLLELALALLDKPTLSDADLDAARNRQLDQIEAQEWELAARIGETLRGQLFRSNSGELLAYGLPEQGTALSLRALSNDKLRELWASLKTVKMTVSAVGDTNAPALRQILANRAMPARAFSWPAPQFAPIKGDAPPLVVREFPVRNAWIFVSFPAKVAPADAPALRVALAALSESRAARLSTRLLNTQLATGDSPALTVSSQIVARRHASEVMLSAQTNPQNVDRVKNALVDEAKKLATRPLSPLELERAKLYARGSWSLERQNLRERAFLSGQSAALEFGADFSMPARLQSVSAEQVAQAAKKYFGQYAVALVMPRDVDEE